MQFLLTQLRQGCPDGLVNRSCSQRTADNKEIPFTFHLSPFTFQQVLPYGVTRQNDFLGGEETLHTFVRHADTSGIVLQQLIGHAGKTVLFLQQHGDTHLCCHFHCGPRGISAYADSHIGFEFADDFLDLSH